MVRILPAMPKENNAKPNNAEKCDDFGHK